jgi:hypothetical protein
MIHINKNKLVLLVLALSLLIISACSEPECSVSQDCARKMCSTVRCLEGACEYSSQSNCCGNGVKDSIESGLPGSKCTCPKDYGDCAGIPTINIRNRDVDASYAEFLCNKDNECILGVDPDKVTPQNFLDTVSGFFKASSVMKYNHPFSMDKDIFELKISLDDLDDDLVFPIKFTNIKVLYNSPSARTELLVAEKNLNLELNKIGNQVSITVPLNLGYNPPEIEESGSIKYTLDYNHIIRISDGKTSSGEKKYKQEIERKSFRSSSKKIFFVKTG